MGNGMISERTSERGWELTGGGSAPHDLTIVSLDDESDGDIGNGRGRGKSLPVGIRIHDGSGMDPDSVIRQL